MRSALYLLACTIAVGQDYVRIESPSDGRTYTLDTTKVGDALKPVAAAESKLSAWLYPQPNAVPIRANYSVERRIATATFQTGGTEEQLTAYYVQLLQSQGLQVGQPLRGKKLGTQISGHNSAKAITVSVDPRPNYLELRITEALLNAPSLRKHFETVWYDDSRGILRLRETSTGEEYELPKRAIVEHNLNGPGAVASETRAMPDWLPVYPGARSSPKGKITWMFTPTAEFVTTDPIRRVYEYYRAAVEGAGARLTSSGIMRSGTPLADFSAEIKAIRGNDGVEIQIGEVFHLNSLLGPPPGPKQFGIGIRYTVPKP